MLLTLIKKDKPVIVYNGCQHAREWISASTIAYIAESLLEDDECRDLIKQVTWILVPIVNPDGYEYTWITDRMWRKNRVYNTDSWFGCYGVDNNRNWNHQWNTGGSSSNTCSDTYHGPYPDSEPENSNLADYIAGLKNVEGYIDFHAYSQLWMNPWGYTNRLPAADREQKLLAFLCTQALGKVYGTSFEFGNIYDIIYPASGGSEDWTYGFLNITYSYAVELRDKGQYGFTLPPGQIIPQGKEVMAAVKVMGDHIAKNWYKK